MAENWNKKKRKKTVYSTVYMADIMVKGNRRAIKTFNKIYIKHCFLFAATDDSLLSLMITFHFTLICNKQG